MRAHTLLSRRFWDIAGEADLRDALFAAITRRFPTEKIGGNKLLAGLWRVLFYLFRPGRPFIMRLPHYRAWVHPKKGTLTRVILRRGYWEPAETEFFVKHLRRGAFVIDAGANFGHYALVASDIVGPDGLVVAFEPFPRNYDLLTSNVDLLATKNVVTEQAGLAAANGKMDLITDEANPGGHSFNPNLIWQAGAKVEVPVYALDQYLADKGIKRRIDILKSDTQGFEWQLISGARKTILRDKPIVLCEVSPHALVEIGDSYEDLLGFFETAGYSMLLVERRDERIRPIGYDELKKRFENENLEFEDVIFVPEGSAP